MPSTGELVENFGRNVRFRPRIVAEPKSEDDVLRILDEHRGARLRAIGRMHSYSEAACCEDVLVDLRYLNSVRIERRENNGVWATIGAGCQVKRVLAELERQAGVTLPSVGLITEQAIAGAVSTGTHGSGKHSLSHYVAEVRVATYDASTGQAIIRTISDGPELRAARCSLGCLGIIVSVSFRARPQYCVEEHFQRYDTLAEVIAAERVFPLQQFYVMPWKWDFWVQHRRESPQPRSRLAWLYRLYFFLVMDVGLHLVILFLTKLYRHRWATRFFFRRLLPIGVIRHWVVVDKSQDMLVMEHELFRHVEIEVFVTRPRLAAALDFVQELLRYFDGDPNVLSAATRENLKKLGLLNSTDVGAYTHRYPICVRRILPDDTLISMASHEDQDSYSISFNCYARRTERQGFLRFSLVLTLSMASLFEARPHWGKICPLDATLVTTLYPHRSEFQRLCREFDPNARFRNDWVSQLIWEEKKGQFIS